MQTILINGTILAIILITAVYASIGFSKIRSCYGMFFTKEYWTNYNIVEALSWTAKAVIIVPGLLFGINIWQLYFLTLCTSLSLIWASNKKLLPALVSFNTLWVWISCIVIVQHV
jgi:hypothetical protein